MFSHMVDWNDRKMRLNPQRLSVLGNIIMIMIKLIIVDLQQSLQIK